MKTDRAQVLVVLLWILLALSVLALSVGHSAGLELRLSRHLADRTNAYYAAQAGCAAAVFELRKAITVRDALKENTNLFRDKPLDDSRSSFFSVAYINENGRQVYGVSDEERKINVNTAPKELLTVLCEKAGCLDVPSVAQHVLDWREPAAHPPMLVLDSGATVACKAAPFVSIEELLLIPGITADNIAAIRNEITVCAGADKVNYNTASESVLQLLCRAASRTLGISDAHADGFAAALYAARDPKQDAFAIGDIHFTPPLGAEETNLFNAVAEMLAFSSRYFLVESVGRSGTMKRMIDAVYDRTEKKMVAWHER